MVRSILLAILGLSSAAFAISTPNQPESDSPELAKRATVYFKGWSSYNCGSGILNNGWLNSGCFNLAGDTNSWNPSENSGCVVRAYNCLNCNCNQISSGYAVDQCIQQRGGAVYPAKSVKVDC